MTFDHAAVRHAYEAIASEYETRFADELEANDFDRAFLDAAIDAIPRADIVLDVGCGPARVGKRILAAGGSAVGIDLTPAMLAAARRQVPLLPLAGGDVLALPLRSDIAGAAVAWYALHNLPRSLVPLALAELRRVVRPGGVVVIATHAGSGEDVVEQDRDGRHETVTITYYEADELTALAVDCGLVPVVVQGRPPLDHEHPVPKLYLAATVT